MKLRFIPFNKDNEKAITYLDAASNLG